MASERNLLGSDNLTSSRPFRPVPVPRALTTDPEPKRRSALGTACGRISRPGRVTRHTTGSCAYVRATTRTPHSRTAKVGRRTRISTRWAATANSRLATASPWMQMTWFVRTWRSLRSKRCARSNMCGARARTHSMRARSSCRTSCARAQVTSAPFKGANGDPVIAHSASRHPPSAECSQSVPAASS